VKGRTSHGKKTTLREGSDLVEPEERPLEAASSERELDQSYPAILVFIAGARGEGENKHVLDQARSGCQSAGER